MKPVNNSKNGNRDATSPCKIVSKYFSDNLVMDESSKEVKKEKQSTSKKPQAKTDKIRKRPSKRAKDQKDIRTLIKSKKNELLTYSKDFDLICKQSGIDVDPEQLQLAIALSKSIEDNKSTDNGVTDDPQITIPKKSLSCNQRRNKIRTTLQEYGFQTKTAPTKKVKRYRKHYKLVLVSDTEKQQKIADKYAEILIKNVALVKANEDSGCKNNCIDSYLYNLTTNFSYDCMKNDEIFYICDLVPMSLHVKHNFKDWSEIPGRPVSPKLVEPNHRFKDIECSQEQLDNILSGSIDTAHDIVKSNHISQSLKTSSLIESKINQESSIETESKENPAEVFCENKSIENKLISKTIDVISYNNTQTMSPPINRSCSPDLFDDEVTILDSSKDNILVPGVSSATVNEQNDFMELTNCIDNINGINTVSKHIACFSQGSNKTRLNSNDFMDLTECIPACSQKKLPASQSTSSYEKPKENFSVIKEKNPPNIIDLNQSSNFVNNEVNSGIYEKSLDDTIIMIDEDYNNINTGNKINVANVTSKDSIIIDLSETQCVNSRILSTAQPKHSDSIVDFEGSPEFHTDKPPLNKPDNNKIIPDLVNCNDKEYSEGVKDIKNLDTVDLTQPNFEKCLSHVNVTSVQSIATYEIDSEFDLISRNGLHSETPDCNKNGSRNENAKDKNDGSDKCEDFEEMDLTQSSNSEDCIQEVVHEASINNRSLDDTIIFNNEHDNSINMIIPDNHYSDINSETIKNTEHKKTNTENNILTLIDTENDSEFDNLVKNVSDSKQSSSPYGDKFLNDDSFNLLHKCTVDNDPENQEIDLTQNRDSSSDRLSGLSNLSNKSENIDDNAHSMCDFVNDDYCVIDVEGQIHKNMKKLDEKSHKPEIVGIFCLEENLKQNKTFMDIDDEFDKVCSNISKSIQSEDNDQSNSQCKNILNEDGQDSQNSDIDLTQKSDSSVDTYRSPSNIEVPCELGQQNNISIDYDELYDKENTNKNDERTSSSDTNKSTDKNKISSKVDRVSGSSQQSEVFELSDNEFNYSINQHMRENESSTLKQAKFDIGGLSIIDDFLNRNSFPRRSKLRCSCSSNIEPNANEVDSCLPIVDNTENVADYNVDKESKSCEEVTFVKISTPLKSKSEDNILIAKTPRHDDYIIKTDQVTPMPNYENMTSPERYEELDKFGIKPLKRKRAIQILTHIYNQTHPLMEVINDECSSPSKIRRTNNAESFPRRAIASQIDSVIATTHSVEYATDPVEILEPLSKKKSKTRKDLGKDRKSPKSSSSKENIFYEEATSVPDIRNIECSPEDWVFQKREKAKVHSCRVPLHIAFHNYVSSRKALREAILRYEPINIDDIHKGLVTIGYRYNPKDLLKFMDRKCITVKTADNAKKNKNP